MKNFLSALFAAVLLVIVSESRAADPSFLTPEQIETQIVGNTIKLEEWVEYIQPGGTSRVVYKGKKREGKWWFKGEEGVMCFKYERVRGADGCYRVSLSDDGKAVIWYGPKSGKKLHTTTLFPGNKTQ